MVIVTLLDYSTFILKKHMRFLQYFSCAKIVCMARMQEGYLKMPESLQIPLAGPALVVPTPSEAVLWSFADCYGSFVEDRCTIICHQPKLASWD